MFKAETTTQPKRPEWNMWVGQRHAIANTTQPIESRWQTQPKRRLFAHNDEHPSKLCVCHSLCEALWYHRATKLHPPPQGKKIDESVKTPGDDAMIEMWWLAFAEITPSNSTWDTVNMITYASSKYKSVALTLEAILTLVRSIHRHPRRSLQLKRATLFCIWSIPRLTHSQIQLKKEVRLQDS